MPADESRYRLLIDAVFDYAIYMLDPDGYVTSWNAGAQRFKGYTEAEIIGHHFSRFYGEEDRKRGQPARALHAAATEGRFENEGWRIRKDGSRFWAHVVIDPIRSPDGSLLGFAKITRDLTDRRLAADALRESEDQFRLLVQSVTDYAIFMLDPDGYVTNWNAGAERIKGYRPNEIVGEHFSRFYTEEDKRAGLPQRALEMAATEGRFGKEGWCVRKDGSRFWASVVIDPIRSEAGDLIGFSKVTRDITERKEAQDELERAREALLQSQKMDAIGQLTGGIAHDFNNLLMVILGSLDLARKRVPEGARVLSLLDNAVQAAQRGAALTQRMLAFARRQDLNLEHVDIHALVRGMADLLKHSIGPTVEIELDFPDRLPAVNADANQLELALLNLAVNARDAMPEGGKVTISADRREIGADNLGELRPGSYLCLSVADTGEGMDAETLSRAMEPFFTTKGVGKGTGLGLSMVHGMARQSGGRLLMTSQPKKGTVAELWLPVSCGSVESPAPSPAKHLAPRQPPNLTVLVVDDDPLVLTNTVAMLDELGHRVLQAHSGKEALETMRSSPVDLLITDQVMPRMSGVDLANIVFAEKPGLPIILATGYGEVAEDTPDSLMRLAKPFGIDALDEVIARVMENRQASPR
ncbi:hybrid sensor histidine kinase/response regulator [Rhodoligotrophos appendicifer]|uniref:hybrid sensor histidine kinase/response regulator n=1 Tax=Rhodoligotrophos appendicifer TaxID=987056 RepID=UPI001186C870|nr:PAS domain-containing sensor histidine kinase [Rhodoligotrophos appendicifer]